jgi:hypothetical protein
MFSRNGDGLRAYPGLLAKPGTRESHLDYGSSPKICLPGSRRVLPYPLGGVGLATVCGNVLFEGQPRLCCAELGYEGKGILYLNPIGCLSDSDIVRRATLVIAETAAAYWQDLWRALDRLAWNTG